jgi:lipoprotein-anchoring transpeptidase ErfK/SrfK
MRILGLRPAAPAAAAAAMLLALLPGQASAGLFDFFGDSYQPQRLMGRQLVAFPVGYEPGTIIVQFSQRRLYFVLSQQRAISYPIGAPKGDARWTGTTYVSDKRVNPP